MKNESHSLEEKRALLAARLQSINSGTAHFESCCIHQLFEQKAEQSPEATAVVFADKKLSYRELNGQANRLAERLVGMGVGPEVKVSILLDRSLEMIVSILAVLKAGGGYVPLDINLPAQRLAVLVSDAATQIVLTERRLVSNLPESISKAFICPLTRSQTARWHIITPLGSPVDPDV